MIWHLIFFYFKVHLKLALMSTKRFYLNRSVHDKLECLFAENIFTTVYYVQGSIWAYPYQGVKYKWVAYFLTCKYYTSLIMVARDNHLSLWCHYISEKEKCLITFPMWCTLWKPFLKLNLWKKEILVENRSSQTKLECLYTETIMSSV